jgi:2-polyprenyl-3-methyl-5-hydroxy-6-metoxy-1,4-benzoquinol methylase
MTARAVNQPPKPSTFETYVSCKDHLVSGEKFDLLLDDNLDLLLTTPKPAIEDLGRYYNNEAYISHTDANKSLVEKTYQIVKKYSLKKKLKLVNSFNTDRIKILDIGSGTGDFLNICAEHGWEATGVEPNEKARNSTMSKSSNAKIALFKSVEDLKKESAIFLSYDVITLWHTLEHVPNLDETIFNLKKLLKPEGVLVVAAPNFKSYDAEYYQKYWAAYDVPRHLWHFSQTAIRRLFFFQSMEVVETRPMLFDAFYVSLLSERNKNKKNKYLKAFWVGCKSNWKAKRTREYSSLIYIIKNTKKWF